MKTLVGLVLIALCACGSDATPTSSGAIEGVVRDEFTKKGLSGAKVHFVSDTLDDAETVTGSEGTFTLNVRLTAGVRFGMLSASRDGYSAGKQQSVYFDGTALTAELLLRPQH